MTQKVTQRHNPANTVNTCDSRSTLTDKTTTLTDKTTILTDKTTTLTDKTTTLTDRTAMVSGARLGLASSPKP